MKIMSIDLGKVRTGVAVSDPYGMLAYPLCVINEKNIDNLVDKIKDLVLENNCEEIVLGLPVNMDGSEGGEMVKAEKKRRWGQVLGTVRTIMAWAVLGISLIVMILSALFTSIWILGSSKLIALSVSDRMCLLSRASDALEISSLKKISVLV